jgi:hypothetical protein
MTAWIRTMAMWLLIGAFACPGICAAQDDDLWRARAGRIPIGATVKLRTNDGERLKAVLMRVDESGILVRPATRLPEPSRHVAFDSLADFERYYDRVSFPKYIGLGAAIAGSVFLTLLVGAR